MSCKKCGDFPVPLETFEEVATNDERHATLYRCLNCKTLFEVFDEARGINFTPEAELRLFYPGAFE